MGRVAIGEYLPMNILVDHTGSILSIRLGNARPTMDDFRTELARLSGKALQNPGN